MRMSSLYSKLVLALFLVMAALGSVFMFSMRYSTGMYQQEVQQKLNLQLARQIVADSSLLQAGQLNQAALKTLFHQLMVYNPSIEVYLLAPDGRVLAYDAPPEKILRKQVALKPIQQFLLPIAQMPILGDDPRDISRQKVFSVAVIQHAGVTEGYLYVILGGEIFSGIAEMLEGSHILSLTLWMLAGSLLLALLIGMVAFFKLTRPLSRLATLVARMRVHQRPSDMNAAHTRDEMQLLQEGFSELVSQVESQMQALQHNDQMRRELIANVSHDLRTPLATLHGYLETLLLKNQSLTEAERLRYLQIAEMHSHRLAQLIEELFELSRLDACEQLLNLDRFSMAELVQDVLQKFGLRAQEAGIRLDATYDAGPAYITGDIGLLQRVLENLLENALRHTPKGGEISIQLREAADQIQLSVRDTGVGIPEGELPYIFERFYRVDKSRQGNGINAGLGLAIVKRILDLHGSQIQVNSLLQQGSTFVFRLQKAAVPGVMKT